MVLFLKGCLVVKSKYTISCYLRESKCTLLLKTHQSVMNDVSQLFTNSSTWNPFFLQVTESCTNIIWDFLVQQEPELPALDIYTAKPNALFFKEIPLLNFKFIKLLLELVFNWDHRII